MKALVAGVLLSAVLVAACTDSPPTSTGPANGPGVTLQTTIPVPCPSCVFGPQKFVRRQGDRITTSFSTTPGSYILSIEDDGDPLTTARVWVNGTEIIMQPDLLGGVNTLSVPVDLLDDNLIMVAVRGGVEHYVTIWIEPALVRVFGPQKFVRRQGDRITATFQAQAQSSCTLTIEDDGDPLTTAVVWLNGVVVVNRNDLLGPTNTLSVPVEVLTDNTLEVSVRGGVEHWVRIWIDCGQAPPPPPPSGLDVIPDNVEKLPGGTQQFSVVSGPAGPYIWSVHGVDGGDATFGTIDGTGYYVAPAAVPTPATFQVCARVAAQPLMSDCADVTISPIPTAGEDVIVFNDINMLDDNSMANSNNVLMLHNLLTYTTGGPRGTGTEVLMDGAHAPICGSVYCGASWASFQAQVVSEGFTLTVQNSGDLSVIAPSVKVLFLYLPTVFYTAAEINAMKAFASEGGRIVFIGEHSGFYGGGFPAQNDFLTKMGAQMTNVGDYIDCGYNTLPGASLRTHQVTTGMTDVTMACSSQIILGPNDFALYFDASNSYVLSGVAKIDVTPIPVPAPIMTVRSAIPAGWAPTHDAAGNPLN